MSGNALWRSVFIATVSVRGLLLSKLHDNLTTFLPVHSLFAFLWFLETRSTECVAFVTVKYKFTFFSGISLFSHRVSTTRLQH